MLTRNKASGSDVKVVGFPESIPVKIQRTIFEIGGLVLILFHLAGLILLELDRLLRDTMSLRTPLFLRNTLL